MVAPQTCPCGSPVMVGPIGAETPGPLHRITIVRCLSAACDNATADRDQDVAIRKWNSLVCTTDI